jgi:hypothetical protein
MENKNISQIALERIKEEGIKPLSRKIFSIKRVLFWVAVAISLIVGAFTFALVLSGFFNNDWDLYNKYGFNFILKTLPYFWLISLGVFTVLGEFYYRKTLLGHRRSFIFIMAVYMVSTTIFGSILYSFGTDEYVENYVTENVPEYSNFIFNKYETWSHPEDGLLSGTITKVGSDVIEIIDFNGFTWVVNTKDSSIVENTLIKVGENVKIIGDSVSPNIFNADEIRSWVGMR